MGGEVGVRTRAHLKRARSLTCMRTKVPPRAKASILSPFFTTEGHRTRSVSIIFAETETASQMPTQMPETVPNPRSRRLTILSASAGTAGAPAPAPSGAAFA